MRSRPSSARADTEPTEDPEPVWIEAGPRRYPAYVGPGVLEKLPIWLDGPGLRGRLRIVADADAWACHGAPLANALDSAGRSWSLYQLSGGEAAKSLDGASAIYDWLLEVGTDRSDCVAALGGGVVGDLAGFVAATFLRGLPLAQLPTTLLAQVDSSIGGKVAVNHRLGKNLIGAFHQPALVAADTRVLTSLPTRDYRAGWAEIIKMAMIADAGLFDLIRRRADDLIAFADEALLGTVIRRAVELKGQVVGEDERESGQRVILNYGHTIGHAIEAATDYGRYLHGEAVAIGMAGAAAIAVARGLLAEPDLRAQADLLRRFDLPARVEGISADALLAPMSHDKKARGKTIQWVFATGIGSVTTARDVSQDEVAAALRAVGCA